MLAQRNQKPTEEEWLAQKPRLKKLWLDEDKSLSAVRDIMEGEHSFHATKWEREKHFRNHWKWSKYHKKKDWEQISAATQERRIQGEKTEVCINGELQSDQKIRKQAARYKPRTSQCFSAPSITESPQGMVIRSPTLDMTATWTDQLPFHRFESHLRFGYNPISLPSPPSIREELTICNEAEAEGGCFGENLACLQYFRSLKDQPGMRVNSTTHHGIEICTPGTSSFTALKSIVPKPITDETLPGSSSMHSCAQIFDSPLHRQILCSVANNFAGLSALATQDIMLFLQREVNEKLYRTASSDRGYTSRAIIQNMFKAAIEAGDARIAETLIRENPVDVRINEQSCVIDNCRYTPIERTAMLGHEEMVRILLSHGADIHRTYRDEYSSEGGAGAGALDYAVIGTGQDPVEDRVTPHPQIILKLLEKGGDLSRDIMEGLVQSDRELTTLIISAHAHKNAAKWSEWGIFHDAMTYFDDQSSIKIISIMLESRVDINYDKEQSHLLNFPNAMLDIAAQRGKLTVVDHLLNVGAFLTGDTLPCAVRSQNEDLVQSLLERGADVNSIGSLVKTSLSVAISIKDAGMVKLLEHWGASIINQSKAHYTAMVRAVSEVQDIQFIEELIQLGIEVDSKDLGYALLIATIDGRDEDVEKLIDVGADVNIEEVFRGVFNPSKHGGPPLFEALKGRRKSLVFSLLDADADPCYWRQGPRAI